MTSSADTGASGRLGLVAAPGGLSLVQDLLNSAAIAAFAVPDLLADPGSAQAWLADTQAVWARETGRAPAPLGLEECDLPVLVDARDRVRAWLGGADVDLPQAAVALGGRVGARITYGPDGRGADGVLGVVLAELLLAERDGTLGRLKTCANPACGAAFYDRSRNASRVWHDVRTCGNVTNLRASRARRRAAAEDAAREA